MKIRNNVSTKLLAAVLSLVMIFTCVTATAFAETVSEDAGVHVAYDTYLSLGAAIENNDYEAMLNALETMDEITSEFNDAQVEEWNAVVEENIGLEAYLDTVFMAAYISMVAEAQAAYQADKNIKTGWEFTVFVDECIAAGIDLDKLDSMIENVSADYEEALANYSPAENVVAIYEGFIAVQDALLWGMIEDLQLAVEAFPVDSYNEATDEEMAQLALLFDIENAEEAANLILSDWIDANVVLEVAAVYNAYAEEANVDTATAFVEMIDSYDEMYEGDRTLIESFFLDISEAYDEAKALLSGDEDTDNNDNQDNEDTSDNDNQNDADGSDTETEDENKVSDDNTGKTEDKNSSTVKDDTTKTTTPSKTNSTVAPKTGDGNNMLMYIAIMSLAGVVVLSLAKSRKEA